MSLIFEPVTFDKQKPYLRYLANCPQISSDYSFVNLWAWVEAYELSWAWEGDLVWIRQSRPQLTYWAPVGAWYQIDWLTRLSRHRQQLTTLQRIPEKLKELWQPLFKDEMIFREERGQWDYLYEIERLVSLRGNRFHKKKNLLNQFLKKYRSTYAPLGQDSIKQVIEMQTAWCTWRDCESSETLSAENQAVGRVLADWDKLQGVLGGGIFMDQKIIGYTIAERLSNDTLLIHFEKADPLFKGSYQAVNQMFLKGFSGKQTIVNREQDLDDAGLRQAKLSYHPIDFIRKYSVNLTDSPVL